MLNPKELRFSGIGRFVEEQVIDFENLGNLVQVDGENKNTGGSSGAGKSTVFHALDYLLGLNDIPSTILQSRVSEEPIKVSGLFDYNGKTLKISRNKGKLAIDLDGTERKGSSKISEEKLDEILAMPRDLFRKILHKRQKEGGFFLSLTPTDMNDFLTDCLGLSKHKKDMVILEARIKELSDKKTLLAFSLNSSRVAVKTTQDAILALGMAPIRDIHQEVIFKLKLTSDQSSGVLLALLASQKIEYETLELQRPVAASTAVDSSARLQLEQNLTQLREQMGHLFLAEKDRQSAVNKSINSLKLELATLAEKARQRDYVKPEAATCALEIKKIRECLCPTCLQNWATPEAKVKEASLLEKIKKFKDIIQAGDEAVTLAETKNTELASLLVQAQPQIPPGHAELQSQEIALQASILMARQGEAEKANAIHHLNKVKQDQFAEQQKALREKHDRASEQARGQAEVDRRALDAAVNKMRAYDSALKSYSSSLTSLQEQEKGHQARVDQHDLELTKVVNELEKAEELKKALKSHLSRSFDEALEEIGNNATAMIRHVPNMANATIQLEGLKETKEGKIKEQVNAVIHLDGDENVPIKSLCGGERSATDLAVDLAVIDLIENKSNKGIGIFILDEPFTGLDTVCIEMALEVLKNSNVSKKLIIVDHNPEVKQMVQSRLVVVREGATSKISQA